MNTDLALWEFGDGGAMVRSHVSQPASARLRVARPSVADVLAKWGPWVCCMALLGVCEDGIPLAARFFDSRRNGHYVFFADDAAAQTALVEPVLYSVVVQGRKYNHWMREGDGYGPERWSFAIFSSNAVAWNGRVREAPHCGGVYAPASDAGRGVALSLRGVVERRLALAAQGDAHQVPEPMMLVVLHDIGSFWASLPADVQGAWLAVAQHGRRAGVFLLTTVRYGDVGLLPKAFLRHHRMRLFGRSLGRLPDAAIFRDVMRAGADLASLPDGMALVKTEGTWMRYMTPSL